MALPTPDYGMPTRFLAQQQSTSHSRQRPYSVAVPGLSQVSYAHTHTHPVYSQSYIQYTQIKLDRCISIEHYSINIL